MSTILPCFKTLGVNVAAAKVSHIDAGPPKSGEDEGSVSAKCHWLYQYSKTRLPELEIPAMQIWRLKNRLHICLLLALSLTILVGIWASRRYELLLLRGNVAFSTFLFQPMLPT